MYKELFVKEHFSWTNPKNAEVEKQYQMKPMTGYFHENTVVNELYSGIDCNKAYTADFMDIEYYPVYGYFDIWKPYDNHKVEDYNQYLVECDSELYEDMILFPGAISRVTGYKLNRIHNIEYKIIAFKRPSKLVVSNSKQLVKKLWEMKISDNVKEDKR